VLGEVSPDREGCEVLVVTWGQVVKGESAPRPSGWSGFDPAGVCGGQRGRLTGFRAGVSSIWRSCRVVEEEDVLRPSGRGLAESWIATTCSSPVAWAGPRYQGVGGQAPEGTKPKRGSAATSWKHGVVRMDS
jgi:hypothetical protein